MKVFPKKSLGQNFLLNKDIIKKIVEIAEIKKESNIIEIGPGTGNLTSEIIKSNYNNFIAIEKDKNLFLNLKKNFKSNIDLINEDVLKINWEKFTEKKYIVFGNLPYNISAKLLVNWIRLNNLDKLFEKFILMFQKEVADRIVAKTNSNKYGRLSILTNWKMSAKKILDIEPENFFPRPKVKSSLLLIEPKIKFFNFENHKNLEKVTDIFFQNRRKMIKKPLNILFDDSKKIISKLNLDVKSRPQNLNPLTFFEISKEYENELN